MLCSYMNVNHYRLAQLLGLDTTSMALCLRSTRTQIQFCLPQYLALELLEMLFIPFSKSFIAALKYVIVSVYMDLWVDVVAGQVKNFSVLFIYDKCVWTSKYYGRVVLSTTTLAIPTWTT